MSVDFPPTKISKENSQVYIDSNGYVYIKLSGVDDFKFEPNKFIALSGSVIETDTINETTADSGVTIESVKLEDGDINTTQITIGANTLDTNEWAYLDGLDQALKTTDSVVFGSAKISDLTSGRILIVGPDGELQDDTDLTFSADTLTVSKIGALSLTVANNVDIGNYDIRALSGTFDSLTSGRVPFASTNGKLVDDSNFTFNDDTLTVTKIVSGEMDISGTNIPLDIERVGAGTNAVTNTVTMKSTTTANMVDGFGGRIYFSIEDDAEIENILSKIEWVRSGADNSGKLDFYTSSAGILALSYTIQPSGDLLLDSNNKLQLRDSNIYIYSPSDGNIEITADGTISFSGGNVIHNNAVIRRNVEDAYLEVWGGDDNTGGGSIISLRGSDHASGGNIDFYVPNTPKDSISNVASFIPGDSPAFLLASNYQLRFRDTDLYIHSSSDANLDLVSDGNINMQFNNLYLKDDDGDASVYIRSGTDDAVLHLDSGDDGTSERSQILFLDDRTVKWSIFKEADNTFTLYDHVASDSVMKISTNSVIEFRRDANDVELRLRSNTDNAELILDSGDDGTTEESSLIFQDDRTTKWVLKKNTLNEFLLTDSVNARDVITVSSTASKALRARFGDKNGGVGAGDFDYDPTAGNGMEGFVYDYSVNNRLYFYGNGAPRYISVDGGFWMGPDHPIDILSGQKWKKDDYFLFQVDKFATDGVAHGTPVGLESILNNYIRRDKVESMIEAKVSQKLKELGLV